MSKLYSSNDIEIVLRKLGFKLISQKVSHGKFKDETGKIVIIPMNKKKIPMGTLCYNLTVGFSLRRLIIWKQ